MASRRGSAGVGIGCKQISGLDVEQVQQSLLALLPDCSDVVKEHIIKPFCLSDVEYREIQQLFDENISRGLGKDTHDKAIVKMYPTYVRELPDGSERGQYLALDFGGAYFRVLLLTIDDEGVSSDTRNGVIPNKLLDDTGEKLFDYLAGFLHRFLKQHGLLATADPVTMGFCFSFPFEPLALNRGKLLHWAKHFHCEGAVGQEVVTMLETAIKKKGEMNIDCTAIISDTVGILMTGAVEDAKCSIGLVLGKGTNACYIESTDNVGTWNGDHDDPKQVIINAEWREFGTDGCLDKYRSEYDIAVASNCKHKNTAPYEKMVGCMYQGEGVRQCIQKLKDEGVLFHDHWNEELGTPWKFYAKYISEVLSEEDIRFRHTRSVFEDLHVPQASELECRVLHHICQLATVRAATLTAIGLACMINRMGRKEVGIAVDGSLFRFHPIFPDTLKATLPKYLKNETKFWFVSVADGSGKGAALTSAVAKRLNGINGQGQEDMETEESKPDNAVIDTKPDDAVQDTKPDDAVHDMKTDDAVQETKPDDAVKDATSPKQPS